MAIRDAAYSGDAHSEPDRNVSNWRASAALCANGQCRHFRDFASPVKLSLLAHLPKHIVGMFIILAGRAVLQVADPVVQLVSVAVIDLWMGFWRAAEEGSGDEPMDKSPLYRAGSIPVESDAVITAERLPFQFSRALTCDSTDFTISAGLIKSFPFRYLGPRCDNHHSILTEPWTQCIGFNN